MVRKSLARSAMRESSRIMWGNIWYKLECATVLARSAIGQDRQGLQILNNHATFKATKRKKMTGEGIVKTAYRNAIIS